MIEYLAVPGTHGTRRAAEWSHVGSDFERFLSEHGARSLAHRLHRPSSFWSTDVDLGGGHEDWVAGGYTIYYLLTGAFDGVQRIPGKDTNIITHSHGGQAVFYAARLGLKINTLITVGTPVREDMQHIVAEARPNISRWLHLYSKRDWMQWLGSFFDGSFRLDRKFSAADRNDLMPKGHGDILRETKLFQQWIDRGWIEFLQGSQT